MRIRDWLLVIATVIALFALCFLAGRFIPTAEASGGTLRYRYADEGHTVRNFYPSSATLRY